MVSNTQKTFVLVHGAFHGGWCWREVADLLQAQGHRVFTPTLTGLGERSHLIHDKIGWDTFVTDILQVLKFEELRDVILVGHSFAGGTITGVADRAADQLRHLVYFDTMVLQSGQAALDTAPKELIDAYRARAQAFSGGVSVSPNPLSYFGITDPAHVAKLERLMTPHPFNTYFDRLMLDHPVGNGVPATYIACMAPAMASTAKAREYAQGRDDWEYLEINEPHNAMMTNPQLVADLLAAI